MGDTLIILAAIISATATAGIAFLAFNSNELTNSTLSLTKATLELNKTIKESADAHQVDMRQLQISLVAAQLYAATNPHSTILNPKALKKYIGMVAESL